MTSKEYKDMMKFEKENKSHLKRMDSSKGTLVLADPEYFKIQRETNLEGDAEYLPVAAQKLYGCKNCEFKNWICPFAFKNKNQNHSNGICNFRINYLLSFTRGNKPRPRFSEWQRDFNLGIAQVKMMEEYAQMQRLQAKLIDLDPEESMDLRDEQRKLRVEWMELWKQITKLEDKQVDRDTAKKIDVTHEKKITLHQIHEIMRNDESIIKEKVIDVDIVEMETDDKLQ